MGGDLCRGGREALGLGESTQSAAEAAREALAIERGDDPKEADEDEALAKRDPGQDRLAALLSTMEVTGTD